MDWFRFFIAIIVLLIISRKNIGLAFIFSAIILGVFTQPLISIRERIILTFTDPSVILLSIAVGIIPIIGGVLETSGRLDKMVSNLRVTKRLFLGLSPALGGLLPMPGGALLSAPLLEKVKEGVAQPLKASINVWFRHLLLLIYPLNPALIVSAKLAGLRIYDVIPYLFLLFLITGILGYLFLLKKVEGKMGSVEKFSSSDFFLPLTALLLAPFMDFILQYIFRFRFSEIATVIAVTSSLSFALIIGNLKIKEIGRVIIKTKPWNFAIIVIGMFIFLNIFKTSGIDKLIASLGLSRLFLCIIIGFVLGFITGRIYLPASIIIPIFLAAFLLSTMPPITFALTYFGIFLGYIISPLHPCISVSLEYFRVPMKDFYKRMFPPTLIAFLATIILGLFLMK